jgi:hypothetical protein
MDALDGLDVVTGVATRSPVLKAFRGFGLFGARGRRPALSASGAASCAAPPLAACAARQRFGFLPLLTKRLIVVPIDLALPGLLLCEITRPSLTRDE